ncbi:MAG TPA: OmpA family protein [Bryobacteraceae bacterium]|nr:OmpA family protein [Bryobacteraceae bacterium]
MKRALIAGGILAAAVLTGLGIRMAVKRVEALETQLEAAGRKTAAMGRQVEEQARLSRTTAQNAAAARDEASRAAEAAANQTTARERAEAARELAEQEARRAKEQEAMSQGELAAMRKRRSQELDRMQEALSRIAPTRRTASGMVVELANDSFHFDFDKADLRPENRELLSRIAGVLLASEGFRIFVYGYTDDTGSEEYNQGLSERRASSVGEYLASAGLPRDVMRVEGFGKSNPRVANTTPQGRQKNRRVEIGIVDSIIQYQGMR